MTDIWNLYALCRCCHDGGEFKRLDKPFNYKNEIEVYSDMLRDTFGLSVNPPSFEASNFICDDCIYKLRNATRFKKQVVACEAKFQEYCRNENVNSQAEIKLEVDETGMKSESNWSSNSNININNESVSPKYESSDDDNFAEQETMFVSKIEDDSTPKEAKLELKKLKAKHTTQKIPVKKGTPKMDRSTRETFCRFCCVQFLNKKEFSVHKMKFHDSRFKCDMCIKSKYYTEFIKLKEHLLSTHNVEQVKCSQCELRFGFLDRLRQHEKQHSLDYKKVYHCDICKKTYHRRNIINKHMLWHMGKGKSIACHFCSHTFRDNTNLKAHIDQVHLNIRKYSCTICGKAFKTNKVLKQHLARHARIKKAEFKCEHCNRIYTNGLSYKNHMTLKHDAFDIKERYSCDVCEKTFCFSPLLRRHKKTHIKNHDIICHVCGLALANGYTLKRHIDTHFDSKNRPKFQCQICKKDYLTKHTLIRHQVSHTGPRIEEEESGEGKKCNICKKMIKKHYEKHMQCHANRPARCNLCGKSYPHNSALNRHIKDAHLLVRPFGCTVCGRHFTHKSKLALHFKRKHSNVQPCKIEVDVQFEDEAL